MRTDFGCPFPAKGPFNRLLAWRFGWQNDSAEILIAPSSPRGEPLQEGLETMGQILSRCQYFGGSDRLLAAENIARYGVLTSGLGLGIALMPGKTSSENESKSEFEESELSLKITQGTGDDRRQL
jgi:hypothetical protein